MPSADGSDNWLLGVDGGGTKTHFLVCRTDGRGQHSHVSTGTYHLEIGVAGVREVLADGLGVLYQAAGISRENIAYAFFGLPTFGEDVASDATLAELVAELVGHDRFRLDNDMVCAWAGSLGGADGINIIAGTGSIAYGERGSLTGRCGGWGELFGDEGSAYWTAIRGLNAFTCMSDGRRPRGALYDLFREELGFKNDFDVLERFLGQDSSRSLIASLAPVVAKAADLGDVAAEQILLDGAAALAEHAAVLARSLNYAAGDEVPVSYSGGMFKNAGKFVDLLGQALHRSDQRLLLRPPIHSPHVGAVLAAARCAGFGHRGGAAVQLSQALEAMHRT